MKLKVGDKVVFLNEKGEGIVTKILSNKYVSVAIESGFEIPFPVDQLVLIKSKEEKNTPIHEDIITEKTITDKPIKNPTKFILEKDKSERKKSVSKQHAKNSGILEKEVDLHIEELMDNYKGMNNSQIINIQLKHFQECLEDAISNNYKKIIFIHGVGNGRLKYEIQKILTTYPGIRFYDASYKRYGYGATEVVIH